MQETLAAAVMMATGYTGEVPLVAPMCGSGTLAIEAALIGQNRAPGLLREQLWLHAPEGLSTRRGTFCAKARKKAKKSPEIIATDIDPHAVEAARKNAATAGVDHLIEFGVCDFAETPLPPPHHRFEPRIRRADGRDPKLETVYEEIGDFLKQKCRGFSGYVFTGNLDLAKKIRLKPSRKFPFFNSDIDCRLLEYELYEGTRKFKKPKLSQD